MNKDVLLSSLILATHFAHTHKTSALATITGKAKAPEVPPGL